MSCQAVGVEMTDSFGMKEKRDLDVYAAAAV